MAAKGELNILVGGAASAVDRTRASEEVIGGRIWDMGTDGPMANFHQGCLQYNDHHGDQGNG
ncbi:hypothetical protein PX699_30625 [Sphingobium sp. H39-3-25]|uniref:hypothetical protein n=1 Tax=Sphingopyxis fribergensis TaxID=1515612 RepID=UPI001E4B3AC8|nr:hypothetical protein [Sphingopyxis fribergensis]MDF0546709.1 hypothetical protein [Sphingobium arseniciresistens]